MRLERLQLVSAGWSPDRASALPLPLSLSPRLNAGVFLCPVALGNKYVGSCSAASRARLRQRVVGRAARNVYGQRLAPIDRPHGGDPGM
jgi:hypothetical protein